MISEGLKIALIAGVSQILPSLMGWKSRKETIKVQNSVVELKLHVNSRLDELLQKTAEAAHAAGRAEGLLLGALRKGEK